MLGELDMICEAKLNQYNYVEWTEGMYIVHSFYCVIGMCPIIQFL